MVALLILALFSCDDPGALHFSWHESDISWSGPLDHFHIYLSVNGSEFSFVDAMASTHLSGTMGTASHPYHLQAEGDVLIKVQAATALWHTIRRSGFRNHPDHVLCEAGPLSEAIGVMRKPRRPRSQ